jgi:serine/threonine protein kinase
LFEQELSIMALLREQENIAKIVGFSRGQYYSILMKFYHFGSLDNFLAQKGNKITKNILTSFSKDIAYGLLAMHVRELAHCDIKSANVLIDTDSRGYAKCVLTDFGITQILSTSIVVGGFNITSIKGLSYHYCSPEVFRRNQAKGGFSDSPQVYKAGDVYALASIMYEIVARITPWSKP